MMYTTNQNKRPIQIAILFSIATFILYLFGAYLYPKINRVGLICFLAITNLSMYYGWIWGTKRKRFYSVKSYNIRFKNLINILFWTSLICSIPKFILYSGIYEGGIAQIVSNVRQFFVDAQDIYAARQDLSNVTGIWKYIHYIVVLQGPLYWAYIPTAMLLWDRLSKFKKIGTLFIWMLYLLQYLCTGTNVGFFDFFLTFAVISTLKSSLGISKSKIKKHANNRNLILLLFIAVLLISIFSISMSSRVGDAFWKPVTVGNYSCPINEDGLLWNLVPPAFRSIFAYFTRYLAQPYNALAMALDVNFETTFGIGNSWFLLDNVGFLSDWLWERTYNLKLAEIYDYGYYANWHTAYVWFANDVSFIGVPFLFFFLFAFFGRSWMRFLETKDYFSFLIFMIFVKIMIFISANNQVFQNSDTTLAFIILLIFSMNRNKISCYINL